MSKVKLTLKTRLRFSHHRLGASNAFVIVEPPYAGPGESIEKHRTGTQPALSAGACTRRLRPPTSRPAGSRNRCVAQRSPEQQPAARVGLDVEVNRKVVSIVTQGGLIDWQVPA